MREWITGRNPVYEVLRARRRHIYRLWVSQKAQTKGRLSEILHICSNIDLRVERVPRQRLDRLSSSHQGVALEVGEYPYQTLYDVFDLAEARGEPPFILILDSLKDPQNLGTLLRTAEAVGVHGVLLPFRQTASVTPAVVNASSGASEHLIVVQANLAQAINTIKDAGIWVVGLESSPEAITPGSVRLDGPMALTVGSEFQGMRQLVKKSCDILLRLPMGGEVASLNAAVAGSVALYLVWQARGFPEDNQK